LAKIKNMKEQGQQEIRNPARPSSEQIKGRAARFYSFRAVIDMIEKQATEHWEADENIRDLMIQAGEQRWNAHDEFNNPVGTANYLVQLCWNKPLW